MSKLFALGLMVVGFTVASDAEAAGRCVCADVCTDWSQIGSKSSWSPSPSTQCVGVPYAKRRYTEYTRTCPSTCKKNCVTARRGHEATVVPGGGTKVCTPSELSNANQNLNNSLNAGANANNGNAPHTDNIKCSKCKRNGTRKCYYKNSKSNYWFVKCRYYSGGSYQCPWHKRQMGRC